MAWRARSSQIGVKVELEGRRGRAASQDLGWRLFFFPLERAGAAQERRIGRNPHSPTVVKILRLGGGRYSRAMIAPVESPLGAKI